MKHKTDYVQPDFFRFGWDQLFLVQTILNHTKLRGEQDLVELGAGGGIISCELSQKMSINLAHLVEYQQAEWEPYLRENIRLFGKFGSIEYHWSKVSVFNLDGRLQLPLIVSNPPYFLAREGKGSADPRRNIAHRFVIDDWQAWVDAMVRTLAPGGEAWWLHRDPGPQGKPTFPKNFEWQHVIRSGRMRIIRLTRLNVE